MNEIRKLIETIEQINEDRDDARPDPKYYLGELRSDLYQLANKAAEYSAILHEYPHGTTLAVELANEVERECDKLRKLIHEVL